MKLSRTLFSLVLALVLALPTMVVPAQAEAEKVINLFTWATYIDDDTLAKFEAASGLKVNYSYLTSNEEMLAKLEANDGSEYDLVLASDYALEILRKTDLIQPLNKDLLPNFGNLNHNYLGRYFDPESAYVVPYTAGTPMLVYDPAKVDFEIKGYADLWNEQLKNQVVLVDDARNIVGITLKTMGKSFNETEPAVLAEAATRLNPLFPNVVSFDYDTPYTVLTSGQATVGYMFTPFVQLALMERPDLKAVFPEEGLGFGIDGFVIPKNAPHPENAHMLLNFLLDGEVAANTAKVQMYMTPNSAALTHMTEEEKNNPTYVTDEQIASAEFIMDVGDATSIYQDIWTAFKAQ